MKRLSALAFLALAGCDEPMQPVAPPPEIQVLMNACQGGDLQACQAVSNARQQREQNLIAAAAAAPRPYTAPLPYGPFMNNRRCTVNPFGQMICG